MLAVVLSISLFLSSLLLSPSSLHTSSLPPLPPSLSLSTYLLSTSPPSFSLFSCQRVVAMIHQTTQLHRQLRSYQRKIQQLKILMKPNSKKLSFLLNCAIRPFPVDSIFIFSFVTYTT